VNNLETAIKVVATLQRKLEGFKQDKIAADAAIAEIVAETQVGKDLARAKEMIQATTDAIAQQKELVETLAIEAFMATEQDKQLSLMGGATVVRNQAEVIIEDSDKALAYVHERAPAMVKLVPVNRSGFKSHLRKCAEKLDPEGVGGFVQVHYAPKVLYYEKKLAALLVEPEMDEDEDNRVPF